MSSRNWRVIARHRRVIAFLAEDSAFAHAHALTEETGRAVCVVRKEPAAGWSVLIDGRIAVDYPARFGTGSVEAHATAARYTATTAPALDRFGAMEAGRALGERRDV